MEASHAINQKILWPRAIILVDMNAFFASIEQHDHPELRGRPIVITNGDVGTCVITSSYEARFYGIKTGMRLKDAKLCCPYLTVVPTRPKRYAEVSRNIMSALTDITPQVEVFSVDEAFLDVTYCQKLWGDPASIGQMVKHKIARVSGLLCSIGVSGDKTTAKFAAKLNKPNGFAVIPPWEAKQRLAKVPVMELCGIGEGIARFLGRYGVKTCGDMAKLPISIVAQRFGNPGRRIWLMCQGADPDKVNTTINEPKSMGHGKIMPPNTKDKTVILTYMYHMCEKLAARLRRHDMQAQHFFIGWRSYGIGWLGEKCKLVVPSNDGKEFYALGEKILENMWSGQPVFQVQVTALDPQYKNMQPDLFATISPKRQKLNMTIDEINRKFGEFAVAPAPLLNRSNMHNVIAPAWKPEGHRQTV